MVLLLLAAALALPVGAAAERKAFSLSGFDRIYFSGAGTLRLTQGDLPALQAQAAQTVLDGLVIEVYDGVLFIESSPADAAELVIDLTLPELRELVSDGHSLVVADSLQVDDLLLEANGAGVMDFTALQADELIVTGHDGTTFSMSGQVGRQVLDLEGSGSYRARNLASRSVEATVNGTSVVLLAVAELLDVRVAGDAVVRYSGTPYVLRRVSGSGSVEPVTDQSI